MNEKFYNEWKLLIKDYYKITEKKEKNYEIVFPIIVSLVIVFIYAICSKTPIALKSLSLLLPTVLSILIGFTITCITVIVTSDNENIRMLKSEFKDNIVIANDLVSYYQILVINFSYLLLIQVMLLIIVLFTLFITGIMNNVLLCYVLLYIQVLGTIHILMLMIRNITTFYLIQFLQKK